MLFVVNSKTKRLWFYKGHYISAPYSHEEGVYCVWRDDQGQGPIHPDEHKYLDDLQGMKVPDEVAEKVELAHRKPHSDWGRWAWQDVKSWINGIVCKFAHVKHPRDWCPSDPVCIGEEILRKGISPEEDARQSLAGEERDRPTLADLTKFFEECVALAKKARENNK